MGLSEDIQTVLRRQGHLQVDVDTDDEADAWRKSARAAARRIDRPVETAQHRHIVLAALKDWPANELEQQIEDAERRNVVSQIADLSGRKPTALCVHAGKPVRNF